MENIKWYKKWWGVLLVIFFVFVLAGFAAFGVYVFKLAKVIKEGGVNTTRTSIDDPEIAKKRIIAESKLNYWVGDSDAELVIVEFSDFECPYCAQSAPVLRKIVQKYSNNVKLIYRDFPLHDNSKLIATVARCAGEQMKFWQMHDKLFERTGQISEREIENLARSVGINVSELNECRDNPKHDGLINKDISDGLTLGVSGTPTWIINGYVVEGALSEEHWDEIINRALLEFKGK